MKAIMILSLSMMGCSFVLLFGVSEKARGQQTPCPAICGNGTWRTCAGTAGSAYPTDPATDLPNCNGQCWPGCESYPDECESVDVKNSTTVPQGLWMESVASYSHTPAGQTGTLRCVEPSVVCKVQIRCEGCIYLAPLGGWVCKRVWEEFTIPRSRLVYDLEGETIPCSVPPDVE